MSFPDGRTKEGIFENNVYKHPATDPAISNQIKTQEILMKNDL